MKPTIVLMLNHLIMLMGCLAGTNHIYAYIKLEAAFPNLQFIRPVDLQTPPNNLDQLFVVEQRGIIYRFENDSAVTTKNVFLDIRDRVNDNGNEEGLLGLAFHPDFLCNGYFFVDYTAANPRRTVISRYQVCFSNSDSAMKSSEFIVLEVDQPYANHNAGQISFGPDGYLYITLGDGGSGGDPDGHGQNLKTLLGSILRIDVNQIKPGLYYGIPTDNPFAGNLEGFCEEIYAYGLRNPWRISFDAETGKLWAADVGQNAYEEIDIIENGKNYGWKIMEGFHCYNSSSCDYTGLSMPIWEYSHSEGQSITGGYVYRGSLIPELIGKYIYADYVSGRIWALVNNEKGESSDSLILDTSLQISSFGIDREKEIYICAFDGNIYSFKRVSVDAYHSNHMKIVKFRLSQNFPNPFNSITRIHYHLKKSSQIVLEIYNIIGRKIKTLVNGIQLQGDQSIVWHGRDMENNRVESGVYLYRLKGNGFEEIRKMLVIN